MDPILFLVIIIGFVVLGFLIVKSRESRELTDIVKYLQNASAQDRKVLLENLNLNTQNLNQRLDHATRMMAEVQRNVGEMSEIGRSMKDLQAFLSHPKLRGNIGEHVLKELLAQMLPHDSFHLQYTFRSGEKVDAAVKTSAGIIPIDSKFPMENFRKMSIEPNSSEGIKGAKDFLRDIKKHIDDISKKYILTDEGTIDYALMYVPSEAVYYEIVNNAELFDYAAEKRVLPVSPTTFYAYLRAILMSFEGQKIEAKAKEILSSIRGVQRDYAKVEENLGTLSRHLTNASNMMNGVLTSFSYLGQKISNTANLGAEVKEEVKQISPDTKKVTS